VRALVLILPLFLAAALPAAAEQFVAGTEDLPLMPGLKPVPNSGIVFDKPEGRIVEARASGATTRAKVEEFYAVSLPALGWTSVSRDQWQRDSERLKLDFADSSGKLAVGFTLSPQ
jgi:hypothetical protein